jgi:hypothetical protein
MGRRARVGRGLPVVVSIAEMRRLKERLHLLDSKAIGKGLLLLTYRPAKEALIADPATARCESAPP